MITRLLVVEDYPSVRRSLVETLSEEGMAVESATIAEDALGMLGASQSDVILSDVRMRGLSGIELLTLPRERLPDVDAILMTAYEDMPTIAGAMRKVAADFLVKPLELTEYRHVLKRVQEDCGSHEGAKRQLLVARRWSP